MKHSFLLIMIAGLLMGQSVSAQSVFSPSVNGVLSSYQSRRTASSEAQNERINIVVTCSVEASAAAIANQMIALGAEIRVLMGNQLVVDLPMSKLDAAAAIEGVLLIDRPTSGYKRTDTARKASHVDEAHAGKMAGYADLPHAYTGKGVIIGLLDSGFDYTHPMFKDADGKLRIKGVYQPWAVDKKHMEQPNNFNLQKIPVTDDKNVTTEISLTGSFYTDPEVILDTTIVKDYDTNESHGSHCASIAAGRFMDYTSSFVAKRQGSGQVGGMAPDSELLLAETTSTADEEKLFPDDTDMEHANNLQCLWALNRYATEQGKPLIISWSENRQIGFHDGTSTMARYIGNYCKQKNVMALCASNEGRVQTYICQPIKKGSSLYLADNITAGNSNAIFLVRTGEELRVDLTIIDENFKPFYKCNLPLTTAKDAKGYQEYFKCEVTKDKYKVSNPYYNTLGEKLKNDYIVEGTLSVNLDVGTGLDKNDKPFTYTEIILHTGDLTMKNAPTTGREYTLLATITSPNADVELRSFGEGTNLYYSSTDDPTSYTSAAPGYTVGDWNTSGEPVTIGAYATDNIGMVYDSKTSTVKWEEDDEFKIGSYAPFSSYGHDLSDAHRAYPDVSVPGVLIYAAGNSFDNAAKVMKTPYTKQFKGQTTPRDYPYTTMSGTSMATPAAAGIIALWMQAANDKHKRLTNADIKEIIRHSSDTDEYTKQDPIRYGAGKINAYKGLLYVLDTKTNIPELPTRHIGATLDGHTLHINGDPDVQVTIYNLSGQKVFVAQAVSGIVELPSLPAGVYAVKIGTQGSTLIRL